MLITLGYVPERIEVAFNRGGDFVAALERDDGQPWAGGTVIELRFPPENAAGTTVVWAAALNGAFARWAISAATVDALLPAEPRPVRLHYTGTDGRPLVWASGIARAY